MTRHRGSTGTAAHGILPVRWMITVAAAMGLGVVPGLARPGEGPNTGPSKPIVLFDGKSLEGWKQADFLGSGTVKVEDGMIVLPVGGTMTGITSTRPDLPRTNYELRYQAKRLSGVDFFAAATFPVGSSYLTLVNGGWGGSVTGLSSLDGADASENETSTFLPYKNDTWYTFRVRVTDQKVRCWVDDKPVVDVDTANRHLGVRIEVNANKPLGFATWDTAGAVRGIEVRTLTPEEVAEMNKP